MRILLLLLAFSSATLFAQNPIPEVQKPLITKVTATWCPPCGGWGWDLFENLVEDNESSAVLIAGHYSGSDLETTAGNEIANNFGLRGQPTFYLGNNQQSASSGTSATARTNIQAAVDAANASSPVANAVVWSSDLVDRTYTLNTVTQFFQPADGDYSIAVYAVEDGVVNNQSSRGSDAVHKRVLRGNVDGQGTFGESLVSGAVAMNSTFTTSFSFDFPMAWNIENVRIITVLWQNNGSSYDFVNANEILYGDWDAVLVNTAELLASDYRISGFGESGTLTTTLDLAAEAQGVSVELFDANGRLLATRQLGNVPSGKTQLVWEELNLSAGLILVRLRTNEGERSTKVVLR